MTGPVTAERDGVATPRRYWAMVAIWLAVTMSVLDAVVANIALPTIAADVGASAVDAIWIVNAYLLAVVILLLPLATLGDILGHKRVYCAGLGLFVAASLGCAMADSLTTLTVFRFVQGLGGAAIMSMNGALIRSTYPRSLLARGIGYNAMVVAIAGAAGPTVAAAILHVASWRWIFAVNLPVGVVALAIGLAALPRSCPKSLRFDTIAAVASAAALLALVVGVNDVVRERPGALSFAAVALGLAILWWVVRRERGTSHPLVPLDLIAVPVLRNSYLASILAFGAQMLAFIVLPFQLGSQGLTPLAIGLIITAFPVGISIAAPFAGRWMDRFSAPVLGAVGMGVLALAAGALALGVHRIDAVWLALTWGVCGCGFGLFQTPNNRIMIGEAPRERSGAAAGMLAMSRIVGQTVGSLSAVVAFRVWPVGSGAPFFLSAALALAAMLASLARLRTRTGLT
jgi:DHA2 family multidrug resistance protein-like MFS transporter